LSHVEFSIGYELRICFGSVISASLTVQKRPVRQFFVQARVYGGFEESQERHCPLARN
jgi:hypothetical protein